MLIVRPQRFMTLAVRALAGVSTLGLVGTCAARYGIGLEGAPEVQQAQATVRADAPAADGTAPRVRLANSGGGWPFSFLESLFGPGPQSSGRRPRQPEHRRSPEPAPRSAPRQAPSPPGASEAAAGTYRTMCVRLCDGYYWPVSFATLKDNFARDVRTCAKSCGASAALYYYPNPGGELEEMVSLDGRPYKSLGTAFLYRATYDPSCKCRAHPWEEAAIERHKGYAKPGAVRAATSRGRRSR